MLRKLFVNLADCLALVVADDLLFIVLQLCGRFVPVFDDFIFSYASNIFYLISFYSFS
jgi:hypothetical protein